jgi:hypothetical protein
LNHHGVLCEMIENHISEMFFGEYSKIMNSNK